MKSLKIFAAMIAVLTLSFSDLCFADKPEVVKLSDVLINLQFQNQFSGNLDKDEINQEPSFLYKGKKLEYYNFAIDLEPQKIVIERPHREYTENQTIKVFVEFRWLPNISLRNSKRTLEFIKIPIKITASLTSITIGLYISEKDLDVNKYLNLFVLENLQKIIWRCPYENFGQEPYSLIPRFLNLHFIPIEKEQ